ncbi:helix-turn-helix domain-containing protein [Clostridium sp. KNHs205]|jgi:hypothetical protein|uniref:helix-turn-helix domain-containing protein n=1 Tax=Clostridium sp. KNHs205 TaxID=1449050 RepID=UPI00068C71C2|nr:helix-turn-helix domain-containing protein [Clostridium sp. KNHs205]
MSKFLTFEDRLIIEKGLCENQSFGFIAKELGKDRTTIAKKSKSMPTTSRAVIQAILIMLVSTELRAKQREFVVAPARVHLHISVAFVTNVMITVRISQKKSVRVDSKHHMSVTPANSMENAL